jgi:hypothetical protein
MSHTSAGQFGSSILELCAGLGGTPFRNKAQALTQVREKDVAGMNRAAYKQEMATYLTAGDKICLGSLIVQHNIQQ